MQPHVDKHPAGFPELSNDTVEANILPTIKTCLTDLGFDVDFKDSSKETLFIQAAEHNKPEVMLYLIEQKAGNRSSFI